MFRPQLGHLYAFTLEKRIEVAEFKTFLSLYQETLEVNPTIEHGYIPSRSVEANSR